MSGDPMSVSWFVVTFDDQSITLSVSPPGGQLWNAVIAWDSVTRVCFEAADLLRCDSLYVFTSLRPESWVIPAGGEGGQRLLRELIRRGLFDPTWQSRQRMRTKVSSAGRLPASQT